MKTIIHLELSDEERNDLAKRIHGAPFTKLLATRKEITEHVLNFINQELKDAGDMIPGEDTLTVSKESMKELTQAIENSPTSGFVPSRGDEPYLYKGKVEALTKACGDALDAAEAIEKVVWNLLEKNRDV
jgi:hypothetical protein